jgi:hypothetical protein
VVIAVSGIATERPPARSDSTWPLAWKLGHCAENGALGRPVVTNDVQWVKGNPSWRGRVVAVATMTVTSVSVTRRGRPPAQ